MELGSDLGQPGVEHTPGICGAEAASSRLAQTPGVHEDAVAQKDPAEDPIQVVESPHFAWLHEPIVGQTSSGPSVNLSPGRLNRSDHPAGVIRPDRPTGWT